MIYIRCSFEIVWLSCMSMQQIFYNSYIKSRMLLNMKKISADDCMPNSSILKPYVWTNNK